MALGNFDNKERSGRRALIGVLKIVVQLVVLVSVALFSYQYAIERIKAREATLDEANRDMAKKTADLELTSGRLRVSLREAAARTRELEDRLAKEVPAGDRGRLFRQMNERLDAGVSIGRMEFLLANARPPANCQAVDGRKINVGIRGRVAARPATFAGGVVSIRAEGDPIRDRAGNPENTFDPTKPVTIHIAAGGREWTVSGVARPATVAPPATTTGPRPQASVPSPGDSQLTQSVVAEGKEYHLTFALGAKSGLELSAEVCDFP